MDKVYAWPEFTATDEDDYDFIRWTREVQRELQMVEENLSKPLPDDPMILDTVITEEIDGWLPRVASLAVTAAWYLDRAKRTKWPEKQVGANGRPITTEKDREVEHDSALAYYRFVRNYLDMLVTVMRDRVRWAQSVRKSHAEAQVIH